MNNTNNAPATKPLTPAEREFTEKAIAYAEFMQKNKLYGFRLPNEMERAVEAATGEQLFFPPNPKQAELLQAWLDPTKKVFTFTGGNRLGKTTLLVIIALSVMFGRWLWNDAPIKFPNKKYRHRKVRIIGQAWESQIKAVLVPKIKEWWPANRPRETKKNNQGVEYLWKDLATGSTLEIMSNSQTSDVMEGEDVDLVGYDEPPERDNRIACARGLVDREGRELFSATLIKQAWIHRDVIKARTPDGKPDMSVCNVMGTIYDNEGYGLTREGIMQFDKTLKPEERDARINGKPSYLSTLVFPRFQREVHVKPAFKIPLDAIVDISIDFHPSKKWAVVFMATTRNGFKYVCNEIWEHGNPKYIAEQIIRIVNTNQYRIGRCIIDPLAKSGDTNDNDVYSIVEQVLVSHNISLDTASKDKDNGIALVNNLLWTENEMPSMWIMDTCPMTIKQVEDLMYDADSLKPTAVKVDDDFTECLYRLALLDTVWFPLKQFDVSNQKSMML